MSKKQDFVSGQARIFNNAVLESMTKTSPLISLMVYGSTILILLYVGIKIVEIPIKTTVIWFVFAFFFWTFAEYVLHRFLFHWRSSSKVVERFHFIVHGAHHKYPNDLERLLMPPVPGMILATILFCFFGLIFWIFGHSSLTWVFFPGFFLGYLLYSFMHYAIHRYKPPEKLKKLWLHHQLHHYQSPDRAFGVSNTIWDRIFRTMPPIKESK